MDLRKPKRGWDWAKDIWSTGGGTRGSDAPLHGNADACADLQSTKFNATRLSRDSIADNSRAVVPTPIENSLLRTAVR